MKPFVLRAVLRATLAASAMLALSTAQAHQIWLEPQGNNASTMYFGEFHLNMRETSPGHLDGFNAVQATLRSAQGERNITVQKTAQGITLAAVPQAGETLIVQDDQYPLHTWQEKGKETTGWFHFAARLVANEAAQTPSLTLDITPTGRAAGQYLVTFKGKPAPRTKVQALTPSGWMQEKNTNADGVVQFDLPWRGTYVFEAAQMLPEEGERDGKKYNLVGYVTTLSWVKPQGLAALDAAKPTKSGSEH